MGKNIKTYISLDQSAENRINELVEVTDLLDSQVEDLDFSVKVNDDMIRDAFMEIRGIKDDMKRDFMLVGIVDCLLLALIGVTALIF